MARRGHHRGVPLADGLAARGGRTADDLALTVLAWSETTGTERIVLSVEKRLSGIMAALSDAGRYSGPWAERRSPPA